MPQAISAVKVGVVSTPTIESAHHQTNTQTSTGCAEQGASCFPMAENDTGSPVRNSSLYVPQRLTDRKHIAIIQAAIAEFRYKGFAAASMGKITTSAVVFKRTVYNHFSDKEKLFDEILPQLWASSA